MTKELENVEYEIKDLRNKIIKDIKDHKLLQSSEARECATYEELCFLSNYLGIEIGINIEKLQELLKENKNA